MMLSPSKIAQPFFSPQIVAKKNRLAGPFVAFFTQSLHSVEVFSKALGKYDWPWIIKHVNYD